MLPRRSLCLVALVSACAGPGHVRFDNDTCFVDEKPATLSQVENRQAEVTARIAGRQPLLVVITILVVALAGASHIEKLVLLFSARRSEARGLGERLRSALDRYRAHPLRYFAVVGVTFALLLVAGGCYIYLDADKRASERALGMLQFCHLALRTAEEKGVLDEQRQNLAAIQSTAGDIRALVGKLPPEEQQKAKEIIEQMNGALGKESRLVGQYLQRSDETASALREHTQVIERDLSTLQAGVGGLKTVPATLRELATDVRDLRDKLGAHDAKLAQLAARPERACPACVCEGVARGVDMGTVKKGTVAQ